MISLRINKGIAILVMLAFMGMMLVIAVLTHERSERSISALVKSLCEIGGWQNIGLVISTLAARLPTNVERDVELFKVLFRVILRESDSPRVTWVQRLQLIRIVHSLRDGHSDAISEGLDALVRVESSLPKSSVAQRHLRALARDDVRIQELTSRV